jgi:anhydro-N-acetylmuramic acid kinase
MLVIGLMSGTSADGIDVALARVTGAPPKLKSEMLAHATMRMNKAVRAEILRVAEGGACTAGEISQLNFRVGEEFAVAALAGCKKFRVRPEKVELIGSHGQTIFHQGPRVKYLDGKTASTMQIGEPSVIAARTGITTVGDFRVGDLAAGGQGAPLVPYVDWLLFGGVKFGRAALNLGGIANVTVIPAVTKASEVFAFDTGPANMVIDALVAHFTNGRERFDRDARMAQEGRCLTSLLEELLRDPYFQIPPPKTTGREYFGREFVGRLLMQARNYRARPEDLVRTATMFTALSVVDALNRFVLPKTKIEQLIVSGGGARNPVIMTQMAAALEPVKVVTSSEVGVSEEGKEAYAFALLGYETWHRRTGNLPSATGAEKAVVLGKVCLGSRGKS